jgi:formylglycine-generating enzyme required for sulfatase activity
MIGTAMMVRGFLVVLSAALALGMSPLEPQSRRSQPTALEFVRIPPGEFMMGCPTAGEGCNSDEMPAHRVRISKSFEMGKYEVTQAQWKDVHGGSPSHFKGDDRPVEMVSWNDVQGFLTRLNNKRDGYHYRLPTEAEWEYAARAGRSTQPPDAAAWFDRNGGGQTHPAGQKQPNAWGLYDMGGNVWEWVQDWYDESYYSNADAVDPAGPVKGQRRVLRGGSFNFGPQYTRASERFFNLPTLKFSDTGFRCAREPAE